MKTVLAFGCFDILHYGHVRFLEEAKKLGERLIVVVARDATAKKLKGREPLFDENIRLDMVKALKVVDEARLGNAGEKYSVIAEVAPDVVALGYDQAEDAARLAEWLAANGLPGTRIARIAHVEDDDVFKSSKIAAKLHGRFAARPAGGA